ncbi:hypothetical protein SETIT_8G058000v2 [Setaria italica]|uniref:Uncharacterized protein n=1 Tax=Setaria italica TaxID=4555 RepID=A0A368S4N8_SETIT|nr:hypothetical protein SETIT_8G058000v2 [Setaria italica]
MEPRARGGQEPCVARRRPPPASLPLLVRSTTRRGHVARAHAHASRARAGHGGGGGGGPVEAALRPPTRAPGRAHASARGGAPGRDAPWFKRGGRSIQSYSFKFIRTIKNPPSSPAISLLYSRCIITVTIVVHSSTDDRRDAVADDADAVAEEEEGGGGWAPHPGGGAHAAGRIAGRHVAPRRADHHLHAHPGLLLIIE